MDASESYLQISNFHSNEDEKSEGKEQDIYESIIINKKLHKDHQS